MNPTRWMWVWASSRSWWWPGKSGLLQSMGSQRVGHDWATELNWTELKFRWSYMSSWQHRILRETCFKICIEKGKKILTFVVCFLLPLREIKNVWRLQPISSVWKPLTLLPVTLSIPWKRGMKQENFYPKKPNYNQVYNFPMAVERNCHKLGALKQ